MTTGYIVWSADGKVVDIFVRILALTALTNRLTDCRRQNGILRAIYECFIIHIILSLNIQHNQGLNSARTWHLAGATCRRATQSKANVVFALIGYLRLA